MTDEYGWKIDKDGTLIVNSRVVAARFGRQHDNLLRIIEPLASKLRSMNVEGWFRFAYYTDSIGRRLPCYDMTRDGWDLLVNGFTSDDVLPIKVAFIQAYREMEDALRAGRPASSDLLARLDSLEILFRNGRNRADVPMAIQREHVAEVARQGCGCPMCRKKIIVGNTPSGFGIIRNDAGKVIAEFDHFYHVGKPNLTNTWLICIDDHSDLTHGKIARHEAEAHFRAYQNLLASRQPGLF